MNADQRLAICAVASIAGHFAFAKGLDHLPQHRDLPPPQIVQVRVVEPPPPAPEPEPPKPPEPARPEPPRPQVHERPRPHAPEVKRDATPVDTPPVDTPAMTDTTTTPVFGVTMQSTSQGGTGPAMPVGNTTRPAPTSPGAAVKPLAEPVAAVEVTKMPIPIGGCTGLGKYTAEALAAAVEGVVVLDVVVDEHGRARDITVVQGLPHGLTEASIAALNACKFTPGEKNGTPVPVRVRGYKVRFILPDRR